LREQEALDGLLLAGLDHLQITLASHRPEVHDSIVGQAGAWEEAEAGLRNALAGDIYVVVHIIITPANAGSVAETVAYLAEMDVPAVALSSPLQAAAEEERLRLQSALEEAQEVIHEHGLTLVWDLAAPYSHVNPVEMEAGLPPEQVYSHVNPVEMEAGLPPEQVVRQHLYVEPDGDVLPAQGYNVVLGNLLRDSWEAIWDHPERKGLWGSSS
jgi:MoaA/NifB/PqqE/SkfB family radical SAM enzyme